MPEILYNEIVLPQKVSEILEHDFWILDNVSPLMVKGVTSPVKFSAYTSIFLREGSCTADINLRTYKLEGPCIINIPSSHIMQPYDISDNFKASFVVFSKRLTDAISSQINDLALFSLINRHPIIPLSENIAKEMEHLYTQLIEISTDRVIDRPFQTVMHTICAFFFRWGTRCYDRFAKNHAGSLNNQIVDKFLILAQNNFKKERFLEFYADALGVTPKHLSKKIKEHTGFTAVEWINRFVILEAKVMLRSSNLNIQQIAQELNFPSQSFFGKYFKKATGISPKDFRNA